MGHTVFWSDMSNIAFGFFNLIRHISIFSFVVKDEINVPIALSAWAGLCCQKHGLVKVKGRIRHYPVADSVINHAAITNYFDWPSINQPFCFCDCTNYNIKVESFAVFQEFKLPMKYCDIFTIWICSKSLGELHSLDGAQSSQCWYLSRMQMFLRWWMWVFNHWQCMKVALLDGGCFISTVLLTVHSSFISNCLVISYMHIQKKHTGLTCCLPSFEGLVVQSGFPASPEDKIQWWSGVEPGSNQGPLLCKKTLVDECQDESTSATWPPCDLKMTYLCLCMKITAAA